MKKNHNKGINIILLGIVILITIVVLSITHSISSNSALSRLSREAGENQTDPTKYVFVTVNGILQDQNRLKDADKGIIITGKWDSLVRIGSQVSINAKQMGFDEKQSGKVVSATGVNITVDKDGKTVVVTGTEGQLSYNVVWDCNS